jgi:hypothetical protein
LPSNLKHEVKSIRSLIEDFRAGRILVPEFQREYVWTPSKASKLIDSLYRRYPISSLLVWENIDKVEARVGEIRYLPSEFQGWLIDGQQRVTTLSRTVAGDSDIEVVFNVETEEFSRANAATRKDDRWIRVSHIWDDEWFRRWRRDLTDNSAMRRTEERVERVRQILDYDVPIVRMVGYGFEDAVDAFVRINSLGVRLQDADLESAGVAAKHSGFIRKRLIPFLSDLHRSGFERISATHLFRACAFIAHPDGRRRTPLHELDAKDVEAAWTKTERAVDAAKDILSGELGISDMSVLWSGSLLVPVIALCGNAPARERDDREIAGWLACAALCHRYSRSTETALDQDLKACRNHDPVGALLKNLRQHRAPLQASPRDFNAYVADKSGLLATYLACRHLEARDLVTGRRMGSNSRVDRHHILPRALFPMGAARQRADVLANIGFLTGDGNKVISDSDPVAYLSRIDPGVLRSQAIPQSRELWSVEQSEQFWSQRQTLLAHAFNDFLKAAMPTRRLQDAAAS